MIRVRRLPDVETFLAQAGPFLAEREAEHNLVFGICSQLVRDPRAFGEAPYLAIEEDGGRIVGAAIRTAPYNLVLSETDDLAAIEPLVRDVHSSVGTLPGVLGPGKAASVFVRAWCERGSGNATLAMSSRIYRAAKATPPGGIAGAMRPARDTDRELLIRWGDAFASEALPEDATIEPSEVMVERRRGDPDGGWRLWEDQGRVVSLAGFGSRTPNGIRVGPVYTPPESRGKGYASALVGQMTAELLDGRHRFCFLFTDLANPTSNGIYQRIGYEAVTDVDQYAFVSIGSPPAVSGSRGRAAGWPSSGRARHPR
ncbi:MAG: GNAT family N-acetyltransferase [Actinomycetota bacterium]